MLGQWGCNLHEEIAMQQLEEMVTINPGDFGDPEPEYGQLPKNTNMATRAIIREDPPETTPTIVQAALGSTIGVNTAFTLSFWKSRVASHIGVRITTTKTMPINLAFVATAPYTGIAKALIPGASGSSGGGSGGGGSSGGGSRGGSDGGSGGRGVPAPVPTASGVGENGNGGLKGNLLAIFNGDQSLSNKFLREFRIFRLSNHNNASMKVPLDRIRITASYICSKNVNDWVEYMMNKIVMALA